MGKADTADEAADGNDDDAPAKKRKKLLRRKKPAKKEKAAVAKTKIGKKQTPVKKGGKAVKEKGGKQTVKKGGTTVEQTKRGDDSFEYRTAKDYNKPRYYGEKTLYTDTIKQKWRIKPGKGRRDHKMFAFKTDPRATWNDVVKALKK